MTQTPPERGHIPGEFYAIPLSERIELLTGGRLKFERDRQQISAMDALKKK